MIKKTPGTFALLVEVFKEIDVFDNDEFNCQTAITYVHIFDEIKDPRQEVKTKYELSHILMLLLLVIMNKKCTSLTSIAAYIKRNKKLYEKYGLISDGNCPSHDTLRRILIIIDSKQLQEQTLKVFGQFLLSIEKVIKKEYKYSVLGIDGKEVRGSGRKKDCLTPLTNVNVVNVFNVYNHTCIASMPVADKTNEIPAARELIATLNLKNTMVTMDALHCQKETTAAVVKQKGKYLICCKTNQKGLYQEIIDKYEKYPKKIKEFEFDNRIIYSYRLPAKYDTDGFVEMKTFIKSVGKDKRKCTRYFISNSTDEQLICDAVLNRWSIENDLHKEKDIVLDEDSIRITNKNAVHNVAILNNMAVQIMKLYQIVTKKDRKNSLWDFDDDPYQSLAFLLSITENEEIVSRVKQSLKKLI